MSQQERLAFMEQCNNSTIFYGNMLVEEGMFQKLNELPCNYKECSFHNFSVLVFALLKALPEAGFKLLHKRVIHAVKNNRNRDFYNDVANLLKSVKDQGFVNDVSNIARELFNSKPTLPALRDELKKAGLI